MELANGGEEVGFVALGGNLVAARRCGVVQGDRVRSVLDAISQNVNNAAIGDLGREAVLELAARWRIVGKIESVIECWLRHLEE